MCLHSWAKGSLLWPKLLDERDFTRIKGFSRKCQNKLGLLCDFWLSELSVNLLSLRARATARSEDFNQ